MAQLKLYCIRIAWHTSTSSPGQDHYWNIVQRSRGCQVSSVGGVEVTVVTSEVQWRRDQWIFWWCEQSRGQYLVTATYNLHMYWRLEGKVTMHIYILHMLFHDYLLLSFTNFPCPFQFLFITTINLLSPCLFQNLKVSVILFILFYWQ